MEPLMNSIERRIAYALAVLWAIGFTCTLVALTR